MLQMLLDLIESLRERLLHLLMASLKVLLHETQFSLLRVVVVCILLSRRHNEEEDFIVLLFHLILNQASIVADHFQFDLQGLDLLGLAQSIVDVTHDGNDHVQECDLGEKGCHDEEDVDYDCVGMILKLLNPHMLAQREQILIDQRIEEPHARNLPNDLILYRPVLIQNEHRGANGHQRNEEDE